MNRASRRTGNSDIVDESVNLSEARDRSFNYCRALRLHCDVPFNQEHIASQIFIEQLDRFLSSILMTVNENHFGALTREQDGYCAPDTNAFGS
jgi:hypothetical protein